MANAIGQLTNMPKIPGITPPAPIEPGQAYAAELEPTKKKLTAASGEVAKGETAKQELESAQLVQKAEQEKQRAEGMAKIAGEYAEGIEKSPELAELRQATKQEKDFFFQPGQRDGMEMATIASFLMVLGTSIGKGGKFTAMNALNGLNGMMEGHRKRSDDLYKQEKQQFETNLKAMKDKVTTLRQAFQDYLKMASVNKEKAETELNMKLAAAGADFLRQQKDRIGVVNTLPQLKHQESELKKRVDYLEKKFMDSQERARADAQRRADNLERQREHEQFLAAFKKKEGPAGGGDRFGFGDIIATNVNEAVGSLTNIMTLPEKSTTGYFQGENTKGLLFAPLGTLANSLTSEDVQRYNKEIKNFGKFVSRVVSGGRVVPASVQKEYEDQYAIKQGDKPYTVLTTLAQMRQGLERAMEVKIRSPQTPEGLKQLYEERLDDIKKAVPFTVADVNAALNAKNKSVTFADRIKASDVMQQVAPAQPPAAPVQPAAAPETTGGWTIREK